MSGKVTIPPGYVQVSEIDDATHILDYDDSIVKLPGAYSRSYKALMITEEDYRAMSDADAREYQDRINLM